jgi:chromosome partitioning protein
MRKIAIVGFKGGIGKTTTAVSLGAGLARLGRKVLLVDTDTQANVSLCLGINSPSPTLSEVLLRKALPEEALVNARENLDLLPSNLALFQAQQRMTMELARETILRDLLFPLNGYDFHILDCAPSLSLMTLNAVVHVDEVYIPVSMEILALAAARQFFAYLRTVSRSLGTRAVIRLMVPTFFDPRRRISHRVYTALQDDYGPRVTHPIRIDTRLSEAPGEGKTIFEYAQTSRGAHDYGRLVELVDAMPPLGARSRR